MNAAHHTPTPPTPPAPRRGRSHDPEGRRGAVLEAARRLFAARGYKDVGIRAIAAEADVTPGLVMSYFGSKDGLFREIVSSGTGVTEGVLDEPSVGREELPRALARDYLDRWDRLHAHDPWPALIRSGLSHPPSAELLSTILDRQVSEPLRRLLGGHDAAEARIAMIRSVLFGVIMERYLFAHEPARSVPTDTLEPLLADVLTAALTGRSPEPGPEPDPGREPDTGADTARQPPASPTPGASGPAVFAALNECTTRYRTLIGRVVKRHGVSLAAFEVLAALRAAGAPYRRTMGEIAAAGAVSAGGVTQHADRLEEAGLITRERDGQDRRIVRLRLTPAGLDLVGSVSEERRGQERELLAGLVPGDQRQLAALLDGLRRSLTSRPT
ncbi:TetR family transcriptional regulator [Streptomyces sp. AJS327]|uniref:TetR/AcrR family transcriptional regulator n=1 Tax=Streptomyces sp. AJS327 TaxID=2545265 RepID=UPI0015DFD5AD|nr:TetR family transcriptional regulator [Streptomyces sp. AJS327]MBA0050894.1 TetR family transcriptional regulator [Streptomyces sp. AJS327]